MHMCTSSFHSTASLHKTVGIKDNHKALYSSMQEPLPYRHKVSPKCPDQVDHYDESTDSVAIIVVSGYKTNFR